MESTTREELMSYCRADTEEQGNLAVAQADAAEAYLERLGIEFSESNAGTYALAVKALALHWMDNPTLQEVPAGLRRLINQLKYS